MKSKRVWLMCGIPGSGKSTWIKNQLKDKTSIWCSRDAVRFSMLEDGEDYFQKEDAVFQAWIDLINKSIKDSEITDIYVDATHLNDRSRKKVLNRLPKNAFDLTYVVFDVPLNTCIERNNQRDGRAKVPEEVIRNMAKSFTIPVHGKVMTINEKGEVVK